MLSYGPDEDLKDSVIQESSQFPGYTGTLKKSESESTLMVRHGLGKQHYCDGSLFDGEFKDGRLHEGHFYFANGQHVHGKFE